MKVSFNLSIDNSEINEMLKRTDNGIITALNDGIFASFSFGNDGGGITISFAGENICETKPVKGISNGENGVVFTFAIIKFDENSGIIGWTSSEAIGEIKTLSDKKAVIEMCGNLYATGAAEESPIPFDGKVTVDYPIFQAMGKKKSDFEY